jgi:transcriptional regulator with XRE-family HTH domain
MLGLWSLSWSVQPLGEGKPIGDAIVSVTFGERLRHRREYLHLLQSEVSAAIRMKPGQYSILEKGHQQSIKLWQLKRLAVVLSISADVLLGLEEASPHLC